MPAWCGTCGVAAAPFCGTCGEEPDEELGRCAACQALRPTGTPCPTDGGEVEAVGVCRVCRARPLLAYGGAPPDAFWRFHCRRCMPPPAVRYGPGWGRARLVLAAMTFRTGALFETALARFARSGSPPEQVRVLRQCAAAVRDPGYRFAAWGPFFADEIDAWCADEQAHT